MVPYSFVNIGSGNGLLVDNTKPPPKPMLLSIGPFETHLSEIPIKIFKKYCLGNFAYLVGAQWVNKHGNTV